MWPTGELLVTAAEAPAEANNSLIVVAGGIIVAAMAPLGYVLVELIKGRNARTVTTTAPPTPTVTVDDRTLGQVAVLWQWRKEIREADNIHDRTLFEVVDDVKDITNWMDRQYPGWRP